MRTQCRIPAVNDLFASLGIDSWKPVLTALALPPVPLLLLALIGARLILPRRGLGWLLVILSIVLLWLSTCAGAAYALQQLLLPPSTALGFDRIRELKAEVAAKAPVAIIVLGAGAEPLAPEYGVSNLNAHSLERLRYGVWLGRETGAPVGFAGGIGWSAAADGTPEARVAARIAADEYGRPLRFVEDESRDTRESAARMVAMLKSAGIRHCVLVTHGYHMTRSMRAFEAAAAGSGMRVEPAPIGLARRVERPMFDWLPSERGFAKVRQVLRETYARLAGG